MFTPGKDFKPIDNRVRIGHVHLKVSDLERALGFYCGVLGFELTQRWGTQAAFVSAGGYHHYIGLNTWDSLGGRRSAPPRVATNARRLAGHVHPSARCRRASARRNVTRQPVTDHSSLLRSTTFLDMTG